MTTPNEQTCKVRTVTTIAGRAGSFSSKACGKVMPCADHPEAPVTWKIGDEAITTTDQERVTLLRVSPHDALGAEGGRLWIVRLSNPVTGPDHMEFPVRECNMRRVPSPSVPAVPDGERPCFVMHHDYSDAGLSGTAGWCGQLLLPGMRCRQRADAYIHQPCGIPSPQPAPAPQQGAETPITRVIDGKFHVAGGQIVKTSSGEIVPEWEPLILQRSRDHLTLPMLRYYRQLSVLDGCNDFHLAGIDAVIEKFENFASNHPEWMKQPGVTRGAVFTPAPLPAVTEGPETREVCPVKLRTGEHFADCDDPWHETHRSGMFSEPPATAPKEGPAPSPTPQDVDRDFGDAVRQSLQVILSECDNMAMAAGRDAVNYIEPSQSAVHRAVDRIASLLPLVDGRAPATAQPPEVHEDCEHDYRVMHDNLTSRINEQAGIIRTVSRIVGHIGGSASLWQTVQNKCAQPEPPAATPEHRHGVIVCEHPHCAPSATEPEPTHRTALGLALQAFQAAIYEHSENSVEAEKLAILAHREAVKNVKLEINEGRQPYRFGGD